jgi:hypothetical protein
MTAHVTPKDQCPYCGAQMDRASGIIQHETHQPRPGDVTLCFYCAELNIFDKGLKMRKPTDLETFEIMTAPTWPEVEKAQKLIRLTQKKRKR